MNEFSLIDDFFKKPAVLRDDVIYGIGDDAACLQLPDDTHLLVSTDTLVAETHFLSTWDAYDIAYRAVMVNVSDMAAMAATPCWISLALTLPDNCVSWLARFSAGLHSALQQFSISLIGGDTTLGPLTITLTIHGQAPVGKAIRRNGANVGDVIWVSGELGAAAQAVLFLSDPTVNSNDMSVLLDKLQRPLPRIDLNTILQHYATAAIDISDGLAADLHHICVASKVGASLDLAAIPVHSLVKKYQAANAVNLALHGGDDYELCFTTPSNSVKQIQQDLAQLGLTCYPIGVIEDSPGLRAIDHKGDMIALATDGYRHF